MGHSKEHHRHRRKWELVNQNSLPEWLRRKANEYIVHGHRPELSSFAECYKSIFCIHSETGNIWTHLVGGTTNVRKSTLENSVTPPQTITVLENGCFIIIHVFTLIVTGCALFFFITATLILNPSDALAREVKLYDQVVFIIYGVGAMLCLSFSTLFHTFSCHSEKVNTFFQKLDYCGIAVMIMASFVPWLYYSFFCQLWPKIVYMGVCFTLGSCCIFISLLDWFTASVYRTFRAALFVAFGLSGVLPAFHYITVEGFYSAFYVAALHWLLLMAFLYILGAVIYANRIPERIWPGKFDFWGQSHQFFHILVIAAAIAHYHGIKTASANMTSLFGNC